MKFSTLLGVALMLGVSPASLWATPPTSATADTDRVTQQQNATERYETRKATVDEDRVTPRGLIRASELMTHAIYNHNDEQVGTIEDVVIDTKSGKIKYVAMSSGGFLGIGDKLFAVPYQALHQKMHDGEQVCVLNVNKEKLENTQGFNQDQWPNMANAEWQKMNDSQYDLRHDKSRKSTGDYSTSPRAQR